MTQVADGPCSWDVSYADGASCSALNELSDSDRARVEDMAATYLWNWTGKQFGLCTMTLRPCHVDCHGSVFTGNGPYSTGYLGVGQYRSPQLVDGLWIGDSSSCPSCGQVGDFSPSTTLTLPGPASSVTEILIDGVLLDPSQYRLDPRDLLVRVDGQTWPTYQDLAQSAASVGTWQVEYLRGIPVPEGGKIAAGALACELAKAWTRDTSCALPQRIQTITRQGVTMAMVDPFTGLEKGHTGIWLIDSWVSSVNLPRRSGAVYSVDIPRRPSAGRFMGA